MKAIRISNKPMHASPAKVGHLLGSLWNMVAISSTWPSNGASHPKNLPAEIRVN